jgi:hypothetical protein
MSRLDKFIVRLTVQRLLLDRACAALRAEGAPEGPVIELGLGNGRTYDHLREQLPGRRIIVFDRWLSANPRSLPPAGDLIQGDIRETAPAFAARNGAIAVLLHADLGNGTDEGDAEIRRFLPEIAHALVGPGGCVLTSTDIAHPGLVGEPFPADAPAYDYFIYRRV